MKLRSLAQLATYTRKLADALGQSALDRHPDVDVFAAVNRGVTSFRRYLNQGGGGDRMLSSSAVNMTGASLYALPVDFAALWAVELGPNSMGGTDWLDVHDPIDSTILQADSGGSDRESSFRIVGGNLELLPPPVAGQQLRIWYVASSSDLVVSTDTAETFEEYVASFAASELATSDRAWDLADRMTSRCGALVPQIKVLARQRNMATPARVRDTWGERVSTTRLNGRRGYR